MTDGERLLEVRDVAVSLGRGRAAAEILRDSRTSAIAPVLRSAGSPLASCDYFAAAAPYLATAKAAPRTGMP